MRKYKYCLPRLMSDIPTLLRAYRPHIVPGVDRRHTNIELWPQPRQTLVMYQYAVNR